jgi:hypothetical protein
VKPLILCDKRLPSPAKVRLADFGEVIELSSENITYPAISGHPDVFCCPLGEILVVSPTLSTEYTEIFNVNAIKWVYGAKANGFTYPDSAFYNAVVTDNLLIHNLTITDPKILEVAGTRKKIHVNQGYTRCNLLPLPEEKFITSDNGIYTVLTQEGFEVLYINPVGILLEDFPNGFIGGVCGILENTVFFAGSLSFFNEGQKIKDFLALHSMNIIELYDGLLFDGGSIMFIK